MVRTSPPRVVSSALARSSSSASRARSATFPPSLEICRAKIRPSPREPPLIKTTFPENEKRLRHAREASHAPRIVIAIAVPRLNQEQFAFTRITGRQIVSFSKRRQHDAAHGTKKS